MNKLTNCSNCGAPLKYDEESYGSIAKCKYCNTEYHIDKLGMIEEYKVKLKIHDKIVSFYIGTMTVEPQYIETTERWIDGSMHSNSYALNLPQLTLELHSYEFEEIEKGK